MRRMNREGISRIVRTLSAWLASMAILGGSLAFVTRADGALVVQGVYTYTLVDPVIAGNLEYSAEGTFQVSLQWPGWIIDCVSGSAHTNANALYRRVEASCDGTNVYVVHYMNPLAVPKGVPIEAKIYPGSHPPPVERDPYNMWLAFASCLAWTNSVGAAKPPDTPDLSLFYNPDYLCRYSWRANADDGCVKELILRSEKEIITRDLRRNGRLRRVVLGPPYTNGYTMGVAHWLRATNLGGLLLPSDYSFSYFTPKEKATSDTDLLRYYSWQCSITHAYVSPLGLRLPAGLQEERFTFVTDHRFAAQGAATVTYGLTNRWSDVSAERISRLAMSAPRQSLEDQALEQHGFETSGKWRGKWMLGLVRTALAVLIVLPLVVIGVRSVLAKARKQRKESR